MQIQVAVQPCFLEIWISKIVCWPIPATFLVKETHEDKMAASSSSNALKRKPDSTQAAKERAARANTRSVPSSSRDDGLVDAAARRRLTPATEDSAPSTPDGAPSTPDGAQKRARARKTNNNLALSDEDSEMHKRVLLNSVVNSVVDRIQWWTEIEKKLRHKG